MQKMLLNAKKRERTGKGAGRELRRQGLIPAVIYGPEIESIPLIINSLELKSVISTEAGENVLIDLKIEDDNKVLQKLVMVKEIQFNPVSRSYLHADLYEVRLDRTITVAVPIHLEGTPEGVKEGGIVQHGLREVEVECLPTKIPESIDLDISMLNIGQGIHISDIQLPEGVDIKADEELLVASVIAPTVEEEVAPAEEAAEEEAEAVPEGEEKKEEEKAEEDGQEPKES